MKKKIQLSIATFFTLVAVAFAVVPTVANANVWHSRTATQTRTAPFRTAANPNMSQAQLRTIWNGNQAAIAYNSNGWTGSLTLQNITVLTANQGRGNFSGTVSCLNVCMMP